MRGYASHAQKRDANEKALVEYGRAAGCLFLPGGDSCDYFLWSPHTRCWSPVEFKNPERGWELTSYEQAVRHTLEASGAAYNIVETETDLIDVIHYGQVRAHKGNSRTETRHAVSGANEPSRAH